MPFFFFFCSWRIGSGIFFYKGFWAGGSGDYLPVLPFFLGCGSGGSSVRKVAFFAFLAPFAVFICYFGLSVPNGLSKADLEAILPIFALFTVKLSTD